MQWSKLNRRQHAVRAQIVRRQRNGLRRRTPSQCQRETAQHGDSGAVEVFTGDHCKRDHFILSGSLSLRRGSAAIPVKS
jgi:hypothetical protein